MNPDERASFFDVDIALDNAMKKSEFKQALNEFGKQISPKEVISVLGKLTRSGIFKSIFKSNFSGYNVSHTIFRDLFVVSDLTDLSPEERSYLQGLSEKLDEIGTEIFRIKKKVGSRPLSDPYGNEVKKFADEKYGKSILYKLAKFANKDVYGSGSQLLVKIFYLLILLFIFFTILYIVFRIKAKQNKKLERLQKWSKRLAIATLIISIAYTIIIMLLLRYYDKIFKRANDELIKQRKIEHIKFAIEPNLLKDNEKLKKALNQAAKEYKQTLQAILKELQSNPKLKKAFFTLTEEQAKALVKRYGDRLT